MKIPLVISLLIVSPVLLVETTFFASNAMKFLDGGYVPVLIACGMALIMSAWWRGSQKVLMRVHKTAISVKSLVKSMRNSSVHVIPGTAFFLTPDADVVPSALLHNLKHNRVLHDILVFISVETTDEPRNEGDRVTCKQTALGAWIVEARFGYMEQPDVPAALRACKDQGLEIDPRQASYFLGRRTIRLSPRSPMPFWQQRIFIMLANQSARAIEFFRIPPDRVVELGLQMSV